MKFYLIIFSCFVVLAIPSTMIGSPFPGQNPTPVAVNFVEILKWGEEDKASPDWYPWEQVSWSPDGETIAALSNGSVFFWDTQGRLLHKILNTSLLAFTWSPDSQFIAGCPIEDNQLKLAIWRVDTGQISSSEYFTEMTFEPSAFTTAIAWSPDGRHIVSNGAVLTSGAS